MVPTAGQMAGSTTRTIGTYNILAEIKSADTIEARIYLGDLLLGKTKMLYRVPHGTSYGWR